MTSLNPCDAFFGGRTNAIKLFHLSSNNKDEQILYYDFTSLYPYVNKNAVYPKTSWTRDIPTSRLVSALQVTILPPTNLYHPVLPVRTNDKLTFPLCEARVEEEMAKTMLDRTCVCHHTNKQRQILGTWCPLYLEKAVEKGYVIVTIHEVWHFPETIEGLFRDYVNTWPKIIYRGWPAEVSDDPRKRQEHLVAYKAPEGIDLDPSNQEPLAKFMLFSRSLFALSPILNDLKFAQSLTWCARLHANAVLCLKEDLPISDLGLGTSIFNEFLKL